MEANSKGMIIQVQVPSQSQETRSRLQNHDESKPLFSGHNANVNQSNSGILADGSIHGPKAPERHDTTVTETMSSLQKEAESAMTLSQ